MLTRLIYASRVTLPSAQVGPELLSILAASRERNAMRGITGALGFNAHCFIQAMEGPTEAVHALYDRIARDPRHDRLTLLDDRHVTERLFPDWSMAFAGDWDEPDLDLDRLLGFGPKAAEWALRQLLHGATAGATAA